VTPDERWLAAVWPVVRGQLPGPPARVLEIGCGPLGGFVPMLRADGYAATGVDPQAPDGPGYRRIEFERYDLPGTVDAVVACTSLHHVADLGQVLDLAHGALAPGGVMAVVEWARERFDEATARWCFDRLAPPAGGEPAGGEPGWLAERRAEWQAAGGSWEACCRSWAEAEGLHSGPEMLRELQARFATEQLGYGPYFFADLAGTSEAEERAAIDAGQIQATRIDYHGHRRS
jgi:SAM-dependent methyltransferase